MTTHKSSRRSYGGESAEDRLARRRRQLLDAGLELFGTLGYRATTVRLLCREAKVADRYFYECFDQTEDLLVAVYGECIERLLHGTADAVIDFDPEVPLGTVIAAGLDAFFEIGQDTRLARVVWVEVQGVSERVERVHQQGMTTFGELLQAQLWHRRERSGPVEPVQEAIIATAAAGGISQAVTAWRLSGYEADRATVVAASTRFLLGVAGALANS